MEPGGGEVLGQEGTQQGTMPWGLSTKAAIFSKGT